MRSTANLQPIPDKSKVWESQQKRVFESLARRPQTRLMVSRATGVPLQNVCRYIGSMRRAGTVHIVRMDVCEVSGMKAEYLSTSLRYKPGQQIAMFQ